MTFDGLYRSHFHEVQRWLRYMGGDRSDLDDLAQEVFQVALDRFDGFDGKNPRGWLYAIAWRTVAAYRRRTLLSRILHVRDEELSFVAAAEPDQESILCRAQIEHILRKMSAKLRTTLLLHEVEGYTAEEIAALLGVGASTVHSRLRLARASFLKLAQAYGGEAKG